MIVFPNAKINIGLRITRKREDGYHDIETLFYPVPLCDILEIIESPRIDLLQVLPGMNKKIIPFSSKHALTFFTSGDDVDGGEEENLCVKAFKLFHQSAPLQNDFLVHLHKKIPSGAGLGGGSSDAAFTLKLLNDLTGQRLDSQKLLQLAAQLGSDCPFFLVNKPALGKGRGDQLDAVDVKLSGYKMLIVMPPVMISTKNAFNGIIPTGNRPALSLELNYPVDQWQDVVVNDFEEKIFIDYPMIGKIKERLISLGAVYASLTGSGSAVYGLFKGQIPGCEEFPGSNCFPISNLKH